MSHDVVGLTDIVGPDLRCRILSSYVMSSVLTYDAVCFVHHVELSHTTSHTMFALIPIQASESPAVGLNGERFIYRFCSFWFH